MDRKSLIAIALCLLAYLGWEQHLNKKYPERHRRPAPATVVAPPDHQPSPRSGDAIGQAPTSSPEVAESTVEELSTAELTLETATSRYLFDQQTGGIRSLVLKDYASDDYAAAMDIAPAGLIIQPTTATSRRMGSRPFKAERSADAITFSRREGAWLLTHTIKPSPTGYGADLSFTWTNTSGSPIDLDSTVLMTERVPLQKQTSSFLPGAPSGRPSLISGVAGEATRVDVKDYCEEGKDTKEPMAAAMSELDFLGVDKQYFLKVLLPRAKKVNFRAVPLSVEAGLSCTVAFYTSLAQGSVAPGESVSLSYQAWFGPKDADLLEAYNPKLAESLDLGFFARLSRPLLEALKYIHSLVGNWGLAVILLTIALKIVFYPLTKQAAIAQKKMKKLQPEMERLKTKYKDDPRLQQQEVMRFMASNKANPMKGCLPVLAQIPVFFAFYRVLSASIELRHAPFFGWISDLSAADPYYVTPLILGAFMLVQQKLTPMTGMDKTQERIMMMLPLFFTVMMLTLPAGLVLYMLTNTIISIAQQQWLNRRLV